jgi:imidazolonepropionase
MVVVNVGQLLTMSGPSRPRSGREMRDLGIVNHAYVAARDGTIVRVGPMAELHHHVAPGPGALVIDAAGGVVTPGLIDPHTHLVFAGWRAREFTLRLEGASYLEILESGGGIISTVRNTRAASERRLLDDVLDRLDLFLAAGTTTVEIKSGYGLETGEEMKCLRVISAAGRIHPVDVVPTFMGAHAIPPEFGRDAAGYVEVLVREMIPAVARAGLAKYADVFCEKGVFGVEESRRILLEAKRFGMGAKIHADELSCLGGAELAAEVGAVSAEHLLMSSQRGLEMMRDAGCVAVLLPVVPFFLGQEGYAPARKMIDMGLPVALATDFNPGTSTAQGIPLVMTMACAMMKMSPEECFTAATVNAAWAIGLGDRLGSLEPGKQADLVVFSAETYHEVPYRFGANLARHVIKRGKLVASNGKVERYARNSGAQGGSAGQ